MERVRLSIETSFNQSQNAAIAAKYLKEGEIPMKEGIEIALSCLFAPLGAASEGASVERIKSLIQTSRVQFETYMNLALCQLENQSDVGKENQLDVGEENQLDVATGTSDSYSIQENSDDLSEEELTYINFDDEEF